jgi:hypothetical protein
MADCPTCEYHKQRAQLWRDEVYKLAGHPLQRKEKSMTQDEMIALAKQAGFAEPERIISTDTVRCVPDLAYFAELVAAKERERMTVVAMDAAEKAVDVAIKLEREACAKLFELTDLGGLKSDVWLQNYTATILDGYAKAIRARGQA